MFHPVQFLPHLFLAALDPSTVENWLSAGGYAMLFAVLFLCGVGLPMPEDIPLIAAGALIANGRMTWAGTAIAAWCGIIGGDMVLYHLGRKFGPNITQLPYIGRFINLSRLEWIERKFERYGFWVVGVGRMFAGVRGVMVVAAGTIRYNRLKFILADGVGAILSGGLFLLLGYWLGANLPELMHRVHQGKLAALIITAALATAAIIIWKIKRRRRNPPATTTTITPPTPTAPVLPNALPNDDRPAA